MGGYLENGIIRSQQPSPTLDDWHRRYTQQASWTRDVRKHLFKKAGVKNGDKVLEVGSGTGAVLEALLAEGDYHLTGIDINRANLRYSHRLDQNFHLIQANGVDLPFPDSSFSISFCHYLLLWVNHPDRILDEMKRVTKDSGYVMALAEPDYQCRIDYPPPLDQLGKHQTLSLQNQGADTSLGRKLGTLFNNAGLVDVEIGILGAFWKTDGIQLSNELEWMTFHSDLNHIGTLNSFSEYQDVEKSAWEKGERILFIPTFYAVGLVR